MVKYRLEIAFMLVMGLYFLTRWVRPFVHVDFVKFYLTDLFFVPAMCLFSLFFVRLIKRDPMIQIPISFVLIQVLLVSIYFEWYLPNYSGKIGWYTSDPYDTIMYAIGGLVFIALQRMERKWVLNK